MPWNLDSDRPIFMQILERIRVDIISGRYQPGDKLPFLDSMEQLGYDKEQILALMSQTLDGKGEQ